LGLAENCAASRTKNKKSVSLPNTHNPDRPYTYPFNSPSNRCTPSLNLVFRCSASLPGLPDLKSITSSRSNSSSSSSSRKIWLISPLNSVAIFGSSSSSRASPRLLLPRLLMLLLILIDAIGSGTDPGWNLMVARRSISPWSWAVVSCSAASRSWRVSKEDILLLLSCVCALSKFLR